MSEPVFKFAGRVGNTSVGGSDTPVVDLGKMDLTKINFWAVEEPFVVTEGIPRDLKTNMTNQKSVGAPVKSALNLFSSFDEASDYCKRMNRPLVILELKPVATAQPQTALVAKLG